MKRNNLVSAGAVITGWVVLLADDASWLPRPLSIKAHDDLLVLTGVATVVLLLQPIIRDVRARNAFAMWHAGKLAGEAGKLADTGKVPTQTDVVRHQACQPVTGRRPVGRGMN